MITSAKLIAELMNQFFMNKVMLIRVGMGQVVTNLAHCLKIMEGKECKLNLQHITVSKVRKLLTSLSNARLVKVYSSDKAYGTYPVPKALLDICTAWLGFLIPLTVV